MYFFLIDTCALNSVNSDRKTTFKWNFSSNYISVNWFSDKIWGFLSTVYVLTCKNFSNLYQKLKIIHFNHQNFCSRKPQLVSYCSVYYWGLLKDTIIYPCTTPFRSVKFADDSSRSMAKWFVTSVYNQTIQFYRGNTQWY